jgi:ubiquinone/menaquinone biosynthesis C-methylase UbiE
MMEKLAPQGSEQSGLEQEVYGLRDTAFQRTMVTRTAQRQAAFFLPHLRPGMSLLDCGCGAGSITIDLARQVAPGPVLGIDLDAGQIEQARALAAEQGVTNVQFESGNVYALPLADAAVDAVFSNALLDHLRAPLDALREMKRVLKAGGVAGVRSADRDGYLLAPPDPLIEKWVAWHEQLKADQGIRVRLAKNLRALLRTAGFVRVEASASYDVYGAAERVALLGNTMAALTREGWYADQIVNLGWADQAELEAIARTWQRWGESPDAFMAMAFCEAVGWC